jgi:hypothetical protein
MGSLQPCGGVHERRRLWRPKTTPILVQPMRVMLLPLAGDDALIAMLT